MEQEEKETLDFKIYHGEKMRTIYGFIYTLRPYERGIKETLGKYSGFLLPGLGIQIPLVNITRVRDIREHTMDIEPQPVITKKYQLQRL